jgi:hypothetical protein
MIAAGTSTFIACFQGEQGDDVVRLTSALNGGGVALITRDADFRHYAAEGGLRLG